MIRLRPAGERGRADYGWLDTRHTFSFANYYDPAHMGFRALRVLNDDRVAPGRGFPTHPHRDFEIVSYVLEGALAHRDSMGHGTTIRPGEVQRMSAGTGVTHSEWNASDSEPLRFLQIWLRPERAGLAPGYEQKAFPEQGRRGGLQLVASRDGRDGSVVVHQDVSLYVTQLDVEQEVLHTLAPGRHAWVQVARGAVSLDGTPLGEGDGAAVSDQQRLELRGEQSAEVLVFDLA